MFIFIRLNRLISKYCTAAERQEIAKAFIFGGDAHEKQTRSSGEAYFTHPVAVACTLAEMQLDRDTIIAALLHDVVEDTDVTSEEIAEHFGETVSKLVRGMTKLAKIEFSSRAEAQAENFRKMMLAMVEDIRVIIIKLADRLHNMSTLGPLKPEKKRRVALETLEIYAPIAHRLGMHHFKNEFQDLAFEALYPYRHKTLEARVNQARGHRKRLFDKLKQSLIKHLTKENIAPEMIEGREKRLFSIYQKMLLRSIPFSEIMDVYAFRIIASSRRHCYNILGAVHELYKPVPGRFKDYIAMPKANGYQSLHTTLFGPYGIPIEIQIRTEEMDYTADKGIASHWIYKSQELSQEKTRKWLKKLSAIQSQSASSLDFIESVKVDIFPDEVYVFTPTGDIVELPKGATAIDFAYSIHTDIGNKCIAARVNRRLVPLNQKLQHGETIDILTSPTATPSPSWLNFVTTNKAKHAIRIYIRDQENDQALRLGKRLLNPLIRRNKLKIDGYSEQLHQELCEKHNIDNIQNLLIMIGRGELDHVQIADTVLQLSKTISAEIKTGESLEGNTETVLDIDSEGKSLTTLAKCCRPIPGDLIIGIMISGKGLEVHTTKCAVLQKQNILQKSPHLAIHVRWPDELENLFACKLLIDVENHRGAIAEIATKISHREASIMQINFDDVHKSYGTISVTIEVKDRQHLARVIRSLRGMKSIYKVIRNFHK